MSSLQIKTAEDEEFLGMNDPEFHKQYPASFQDVVLKPLQSKEALKTQHVRVWQCAALYFSAAVLFIVPLVGCGISDKYGQTDCAVHAKNTVSVSSIIRNGAFASTFAFFGGIFFVNAFFVIVQFEKHFIVTMSTLVALLCICVPLIVPMTTGDDDLMVQRDTAHSTFAFIGGGLLLIPMAYILARLYNVARTQNSTASNMFWILLVWVCVFVVSGFFTVIVASINSSDTTLSSLGIVVGEYLSLAAFVCALRTIVRARLLFE
jgi:hypothetical protein